MSTETQVCATIDDCPPDQVDAVIEVLTEFDILDSSETFAIGEEFYDYCARMGTITGAGITDGVGLADALIAAAPGCSFTVYEEPAEEWLGDLVIFTPELGKYEAECDSNGQPVFSASAVLDIIDISADLDEVKYRLGRPWTNPIPTTPHEEGA